MAKENIIIKGARVNNLKNIDITIPRDKFVVLTGLSGSGKSSLAFDTLYAEGHRRFVESLSSYARMFLGQLDKPDVDSIDGLSPAISIDQKTTSRNPRSTVGTVTEIYDYLRLMYARIGIPHCPICGEVIKQQSVDEIVSMIMTLPEGARFMVLAPVVSGKKGMFEKVFDDASRSGFVRVRVDGSMYELTEKIELDKNKKHDIEIVVDRLVMEKETIRGRLTDSIENAAAQSGGIVTILLAEPVEGFETEHTFSQNYACKTHGISLGELAPRMFSFNNPFGACEACTGLGESYVITPECVAPDKNLSLSQGAIIVNGFKSIDSLSWLGKLMNQLGAYYGFNIHTPLHSFNDEALKCLFHGNVSARGTKRHDYAEPRFEGIIETIKRRYDQAAQPEQKQYYEDFMENIPCPVCNGNRLKKESLAVTVGGMNIAELCSLSIEMTAKFFDKLILNEKDATIARDILKEIKARLGFLKSVGLNYLTLSRISGSLSGGEAQRIRLATQIGSSLVGVLYILDEPSIGLHQRDNKMLIETLKRLRDIGNTLIIVEHDEETMLEADYIVDVGPYAGIHGGEIVAVGTPQEIMQNERSITGKYLSGKLKIDVPNTRRPGNGKFITIVGAAENNLKDVTVSFPLGCFVCVTGVSGSGKSSLVNTILFRGICKTFGRVGLIPGKHKSIEGIENIDKIIDIDQSPIGRTPRSNPATYTGIFTDIRSTYASTPEAKARGYKEGRFSFNIKGGRCEACQGDGTLKIEMHFLPDVYVTCDVCKGHRYNRETLEVKYKGKSIHDVLEMTVDEALGFFENHPRIKRKIQTLSEVGLGYIKLGQSSTTLSGGEAQRVKLSTELSKQSTGRTMYILDEPTTGLHSYDVDKLREVLQKLVDKGNTVIVIEHNLDLIKTADYIIDMGPEGGDKGGYVITQGTPEEITASEISYTAKYLKPKLNEVEVNEVEV
ncbi:MAG: excinuclease ABC subunit A [Clostridiales bacterium GWF2_38_85]|nr:MAG: excinuclease ABC subunit A [Clostridiales bacterium GWF2_38_85]HBL85303.1 excinuclease ABC subunit UvrA [Clostridiales bacterium]